MISSITKSVYKLPHRLLNGLRLLTLKFVNSSQKARQKRSNFSLFCPILRYHYFVWHWQKKTTKFCPGGLSFTCFRWNVYQSSLIQRSFSCPNKSSGACLLKREFMRYFWNAHYKNVEFVLYRYRSWQLYLLNFYSFWVIVPRNVSSFFEI